MGHCRRRSPRSLPLHHPGDVVRRTRRRCLTMLTLSLTAIATSLLPGRCRRHPREPQWRRRPHRGHGVSRRRRCSLNHSCAVARTARQRCSNPDSQPFCCAAFPNCIPGSILDTEVDHHRPADGDRGLSSRRDGTLNPVHPGTTSRVATTSELTFARDQQKSPTRLPSTSSGQRGSLLG